MTDTERLFDNLLSDVATGKRTPAECIDLCRQIRPELIAPFTIAIALHCWPLDTGETSAAQERVWQRLEAAMDEESEASSAITLVATRSRRQRQSRWLRIALCAAILALAFLGFLGLSAASTNALPESPLYTVKRMDETIELRLAWSNQRRGEVLAQIALHRLAEARAESAQQHTNQAITLMNESNEAMRQLIQLAITMRHQRQNTDTIRQALAKTLQSEYSILAQARADGQTALAQTLSGNVADQQRLLSDSQIELPSPTTPTPGSPQNTPHNPVQETPHAHAIPSSHPTPEPKTTPGAQGNGSNGANGSTGGGGQGKDKGNVTRGAQGQSAPGHSGKHGQRGSPKSPH